MGHKFGSSVWPLEMSVYPTGIVRDDFAFELPGSPHYDISSYFAGCAFATGSLQVVSGGAIGELHVPIARRAFSASFRHLVTRAEEAIILDPNTRGMFGNINFHATHLPNGAGIEEIHQFRYPTASICYAYLPEIGISSSAEFIFPYRVIEQSKKKPWYDSYEDFADELRFIGKDYSVIPEFRISEHCLLYTSPSPRDRQKSRMPSSA